MNRRATAIALFAAAALASSIAVAQAPPPAERSHVYSPYEQQTIDEVLASLHAKIEPEPEGKTIERVEIVPIDVFEKRDPLPRWLDVFHATTRPSIVRREMLLREGDRYRQVLSDDAIRNLRSLPQLSVVLIVTAQASSPDRVRVVVITKDVWSLRLNEDIEFQPSIQHSSKGGSRSRVSMRWSFSLPSGTSPAPIRRPAGSSSWCPPRTPSASATWSRASMSRASRSRRTRTS